MGLPTPGEEVSVDAGSGARFSDDVLKIELCGPARPHFSVVDVPGLFQSKYLLPVPDLVALLTVGII
jgi:hypothetical protein